MQINLAAFADYVLNTFDSSDECEDDAFAAQFEGVPVYVERKRSHFLFHVGAERHELPR